MVLFAAAVLGRDGEAARIQTQGSYQHALHATVTSISTSIACQSGSSGSCQLGWH